MRRYAIVGGRVIGAERVAPDRAVLVQDGCIEGIPPYAEVPPGLRRIDVAGAKDLRDAIETLLDLHGVGTRLDKGGVEFGNFLLVNRVTAGSINDVILGFVIDDGTFRG